MPTGQQPFVNVGGCECLPWDRKSKRANCELRRGDVDHEMRLHRGAGILLDATIVRALLVPAAVALFGRWN